MQTEKEIKQELGEEPTKAETKQPNEKDSAFIRLALKRFAAEEDKNGEARTRAKEEERVVITGDHWPETLRTQREADGLPCLTLNHGLVHRDGVAGEIMQNMPRGKFRGFDSRKDPKMAEIGTSLLRRVEENSNIEDLDRDTIKQCLVSGYPSWQYVYHDYPSSRTSNQEIYIKHLADGQYSTVLDPNKTALDLPERGGPKWGAMIVDMPKAEYEREFEGHAVIPLAELTAEDSGWWTADNVRVASYFVAEPKEITLLTLEGNRTVEKDSAEHKQMEAQAVLSSGPLRIVKERKATTYKIQHYRINSREILSGPEPIAGGFIPLIPFEGKYDYLSDGRKFYRGVYSNAIDANKMLDMWVSEASSVVATGRQFKATSQQTAGFEDQWKNPHKYKILHYNVDPAIPGGGTGPQEVNNNTEAANDQRMMEYASQQIKDLTNRHEASLGAKSNETSRVAIDARAKQGENSNYEFPANIARAIRYRTRMIESMIPEVYDYQTAVRIIGDDGKEKEVLEINAPAAGAIMDKKGEVSEYLNNVTKARFDTVVDSGPSFRTQRMEAAAIMEGISRSSPEMSMALIPFMLKANDAPLDDEVIKRIDYMLEKQYPGITGAADEDGKIKAQVQQAVKQFQEQMMPGLMKLQEDLEVITQQKQAALEENAELKQKVEQATTLMKDKVREHDLAERKLDIEERKVQPQPEMASFEDLRAQILEIGKVVADALEQQRAMIENGGVK